jgi:hypothetical protein
LSQLQVGKLVVADSITARDAAHANLALSQTLAAAGDQLPLDFGVVRALAVVAGGPGAWLATAKLVSVADLQVRPGSRSCAASHLPRRSSPSSQLPLQAGPLTVSSTTALLVHLSAAFPPEHLPHELPVVHQCFRQCRCSWPLVLLLLQVICNRRFGCCVSLPIWQHAA